MPLLGTLNRLCGHLCGLQTSWELQRRETIFTEYTRLAGIGQSEQLLHTDGLLNVRRSRRRGGGRTRRRRGLTSGRGHGRWIGTQWKRDIRRNHLCRNDNGLSRAS